MEDVTTELRRVTRRWQQLSAEQARQHAPSVRDLAQRLADRTRRERGLRALVIPDLGDAALADQLAVMVYDACRAGLGEQVLPDLTALRRSLP